MLKSNFRHRKLRWAVTSSGWTGRTEAKFPSMNVSDLGAAVYSPDDGWLDPHSVLMGFPQESEVVGC